jgi:hypothetical protein
MEERYARERFLTQVAKSNHWPQFRGDPNIVGVGFGRRTIGKETLSDEPAMVIYVARKMPAASVPPSRLLPKRFYVGTDHIEVDVVETGHFYPHSFTTRDRPAPSGISIGHIAITAGTLSCLVVDNTDKTLCILSNNHVLANENAGVPGDAIVQPGVADGGTSPADDIATLKRFVMINATGNTVDCAIGQVIDQTLGNTVIDQMKNGLMPVPSPAHPAVGLLFAGSCNRTIMNPIRDVLAQLNVSFLAGANSIAGAEIGTNVEKVGRTTEYTTSTISEVDVTVTIGYDFGPATFDHQLATKWMSDPGDSGSIICLGGAGGSDDHCGCLTTSASAAILGLDVGMDAAVAQEFRDKHLRHTRIGRYAVDLFNRNEQRLVARAREAKVSDEDRNFGQRMYQKHGQQVRAALLRPESADFRITDEHLKDAREVLRHAARYLSDHEERAADELLKLASQFTGKTVREALQMLNDEKLFVQVVDIVSRLTWLQQPEPDRKKY